MPNNIGIKITADIADLTAKRAIMSAELRTATKDLNDFAKAAKEGGTTDELRTGMLAAADTVAKAKAQIRQVDSEIKKFGSDTKENTETLGLNRTQMIIAQSAVMRFSDAVIAGQSPIKAFALEAHKLGEIVSADSGGMAGGLAKVSALLNPVTLGIALIVGVAAAAAIATSQYEAEERKLSATLIGTAAASGLSAEQLRSAASAASDYSGQSSRASLEAAEAFASAGVKSTQAIAVLSGSVQTFAELTGQKAADAQKELASAMQDPVKGAQDLNEKLSILDSTQLEQIRTMTEAGDKTGAVNVIMEALKRRIDEAHAAGVGMSSNWQQLKSDASDLWGWLGRVNERLEIFEAFGFGAGAVEAKFRAQVEGARAAAQHQADLNARSAAGLAIYNETPEGSDAAKRSQLAGALATLRDALSADTELHGANSDAVKRDRAAIDDYTRALTSYLPEAEKAHRIAELDARIATARHAHNEQLVADLTRQKTAVQQAGEVMSAADAAQAQRDAAQKASASSGGGSHGPSAVQVWADQLHQQEIASGNFFRDQTADELKFWQGKLGQVRAGSKDELEVRQKIYDAERTLAHQSYDEHIADLNERLEADRNNWSKEQADWQEKLSFIASKFGEESREYKDAYRQMERAQREHDVQMLREAEQSVQKQTELLRSHLDAQARLREEDASAAAAVIRSQGESGPLGEVRAEIQLAQLEQSLNEQRLADVETLHDAETASLSRAIARAAELYHGDTTQYQALLDQKAKADQEYADRKAALEHQMRNASLASILAVQQAYHRYIDGVVGQTTSGFIGMIGGTQTWRQAVVGVYHSLLSQIDQVVARMVSSWIVKHLLMTTAEKAQLAEQTAAHVGAEAAKSAATAAGVTSRTGAEIAGATAAFTATRPIVAAQAASLVALAGAGGIASMAAAPFPIDLGAPAFGAAMAGAAASYGAIAAFAQGTNELPVDMLALVHAGERIVPAADNAKLIAAVNQGVSVTGGASAPPAAANGNGDFHYHDHTARGLTPDEIIANRRAFAKAMKMAHREGMFAGMALA